MTPMTAMTALDDHTFTTLLDRHRRELHVHCYRMLGSFDEAEDAVQDTALRAWRGRGTFDGVQARAWLYRIATNACLDTLRQRKRRAPSTSFHEIPWLQPYPDRLLDEVASPDEAPDAVVVGRESIELAFLAAIQLLAPRQRAVLILRDVLGWSANETATALEMSVPAANSALQRARATIAAAGRQRRLPASTAAATDDERRLLAGFIAASERGDAALAVSLVRADVRITMPPLSFHFVGLADFGRLLDRAFGAESMGEWRLVPTRANRMPAAASYLRRPGDSVFRAFKLDVLRIDDGLIAEITTFGDGLFPAFGLPPTL
jgi:RNA polymerase sigma-70 factor (ECF subfamily)